MLIFVKIVTFCLINHFTQRYNIVCLKAMILGRFCKGLNDDIKKKIMLRDVSTINQTYTLLQNYELVI